MLESELGKKGLLKPLATIKKEKIHDSLKMMRNSMKQILISKGSKSSIEKRKFRN